MNKLSLVKIAPFALVAGMAISGCGEKSECELPTRHVHKYVKQFDNDITIEKYMDDEHLTDIFGYQWTDNYIEITKDDEKIYKIIDKKGLFDGIKNWDYLYNEMVTHHDYLKFYYYYTTLETYTTTDSKGRTEINTRTVTHSGWHDNAYGIHNTGETRLYHHRYYGYRIIYENGKFKAEKSPAVDDIREVIDEYPYFSEDCIALVYEEFNFSTSELPSLSPEDFDTFTGPDLENKNLETGKVMIKTNKN